MISRNFVIQVVNKANPFRPDSIRAETFAFLLNFEGRSVGEFYAEAEQKHPDWGLKPWRASLRRAVRNGAVRLLDDATMQPMTDPRLGDEATPEVQEADDEAAEITFGLEKDLQQALRKNLGQLEPGLNIIDGGKEKCVPVGRVDILARDSVGNTVVIELKAGDAGSKAVAQILSYMGNFLGDTEGKIRGILIASDFDDHARSAAAVVPTLQLRKYRFKFEFERP